MLAIGSFLFFTGLVAVLSWWFTRRDSHETSTGYFLAGRSLTWLVVGGSLLLTNLSTEQLVGLNGGAFKNGMEIMAWELGAAIAMVVMALVCLPMYLRGGITTIPEFLESRYDRIIRGLTSLIILVAISVSVLPFVLYSGALFMGDVFELSPLTGLSDYAVVVRTVVVIGTVGSMYAIFGGLRAVAISDTPRTASALFAASPLFREFHLAPLCASFLPVERPGGRPGRPPTGDRFHHCPDTGELRCVSPPRLPPSP